jgi:YidC/Oxa1 family membrane protein insertase
MNDDKSMDQRTLLAVVLSLAIWYGWLLAFPPPEPEEVVEPEVPEETTTTSTAEVPVETRPAEDVDVELCTLAGKLNTAHGGLHDATLTDYTDRYEVVPLYSWILTGMGEPWQPWGEEPGPVRLVGPEGSAWAAGAGAESAGYTTVVENSSTSLVTKSKQANGIEVTRAFKVARGEPCIVELDVSWHNAGSSDFSGDVWIDLEDLPPEAVSRYSSPLRVTAHVDGGVETFEPGGEEEEVPLEGEVGWFGVADTYFGAFLVPTGGIDGAASFLRTEGEESDVLGVRWASRQNLSPGASTTASFKLYAGPKDTGLLSQVDEDLPDAVDLGIFSAFAYPLLVFLRMLYTVVGDWALAIISLTFIIKALFFRLSQRAFESSQRMSAIQPQMKEIQETYKDDPQELQRRTMALFQENNVSPLGGCLPMVLQMPVWFALYSVLWSSVELYHAEFGYLRDLTASDPYLVLPTVVMGMMLIQQQLVPTGNMPPEQARMMKLMPLVFGIFFFALPSGLVLYIFVNMLLSILQQWYIKRSFEHGDVPLAAEGA